jgi:hypothetical protein
MKNPKPLIKLGKAGAKFRQAELDEREFDETHDFRLLDLASGCLDIIKECREKINDEGLFVLDRFKVQKEHPAIKTEREQKIIFCRIIRELNLSIPPEDSRPPKLY